MTRLLKRLVYLSVRPLAAWAGRGSAVQVVYLPAWSPWSAVCGRLCIDHTPAGPVQVAMSAETRDELIRQLTPAPLPTLDRVPPEVRPCE